jgi:D-alanyl-D-alanine-carboxypeptidase/D-alanyl-D-alanine-endopeptidase
VRSHLRAGTIAVLMTMAALPAARAQSSRFPDEVGATVRARVDNGWSVGIVVGVVDRSGTRYFAYGRTAHTGGAPVDQHTVYEIGSVTKVFTALALAEMAVRHEVRLDDPVQRLLPDSVRVPRTDSGQITLRLLSAQRSGLPRVPSNLAISDPTNPYADYDAGRLYAFLGGYALDRNPGARYEYSNLGVGLLGFALARREGTSYEGLLVRRVLGPLRLTDTRVTLTPDLRARLARGHDGEREVPNWDFDALAGAGALRSTAADLARFLAAAMGLVRTPLDSAFRLTQVIQGDAGPTMRIGLGWHLMGRDSGTAYWHNGATGGYHSFLGFDARKKLGVVILSNSTDNVDDIGLHLLDPSTPMTTVHPVVPLAADSLAAYTGVYQLAPAFQITVVRLGPNLLAQATGQRPLVIYPWARDEFFYRAVDAQISFVRDSTGRIASLILHQNGRDLPAPRNP